MIFSMIWFYFPRIQLLTFFPKYSKSKNMSGDKVCLKQFQFSYTCALYEHRERVLKVSFQCCYSVTDIQVPPVPIQPKPQRSFGFNPHKPSVLFVGHRQTAQTQIRHRRMQRLIRFSTVCLQNVLLKFE